MAAYIGFDRRIELDWLDETAGHMLRQPDPAVIRAHLLSYLATAIQGSEAREKTALVLTRIWVKPHQATHLRDEALQLLPILLPTERLWLHWGLTLLAFPFFRDVVAAVGRLLRLQEQCSVDQVTNRIIATWGERTTLVRATQRVLRSCVAWGTLVEGKPAGTYYAGVAQQTNTVALRDWFLEATLRAHDTEGVLAEELSRLPQIYPFTPTITPYELMRLERFEVLTQGSGAVLVYPAHRQRERVVNNLGW
jgi:hypothetical protein